ncbi:MAG: hypothetical protein WBQ94_04260 [Terracidiphilus sp.]
MTLNDMQRAALALYAARAAGEGGSLEQMKGIAYCIRNRVKAGWYDGQWLTVIEHADESGANPPGIRVVLDPNNRALQRLAADIDDIYYGAGAEGPGNREQKKLAPVAQNFAPSGGELRDAVGRACYWAWVNEPFTAWFQEHILDHPEDHIMKAQMGMMLFFE